MSITKSDAALTGTRMLTGFFTTHADAENARAKLTGIGISSEAIKITDGRGTVTGDGASDGPLEGRSLLESLKSSWSPEAPARTDERSSERPGFVLTAHVSPDQFTQVQNIVEDDERQST